MDSNSAKKGINTLVVRVFVVAFLLLGFGAPYSVLAQEVTPPGFSATLLPGGEPASFDLTVTTGDRPIPTLDVVFAIDITGSMSDEIAVVKDRAVEIMNNIREQIPETPGKSSSWFGVVSFSDYPGYYEYPGYSAQYGDAEDFPYEVNQEVTSKIDEVAAAINALVLHDGADWPEDYTRVLYDLQAYVTSPKWRTEAKKIAIMFGDAPTHDTDFAGYNFGGDPGDDLIAQTADDLEFENVVDIVSTENISVLAVDSGGTPESEATFKGMSIGFNGTEGTGGQYFLLENATQIPEVIKNMIQEEVARIDHLTLSIPDDYCDWVDFVTEDGGTEYENVGPKTDKLFHITISVPDGTEPGDYSFAVQALGDGALLVVCTVSILVPSEEEETSAEIDFRSKPNGYSFTNTAGELSWQMFERFFGRESVRHSNGDPVYAAEEFFNTNYHRAGGCCDGMSAASLLRWEEGLTPETWSLAKPGTHSVKWDDETVDCFNDTAVFRYFGYYQGCQLGREMKQWEALFWEKGWIRPPNTESQKNYIRDLLDQVKAYLQNGQPIVLAITHGQPKWIEEKKKWDWDWRCDRCGGHALVPYKIVEKGPSIFHPDRREAYIYVYDSNHPWESIFCRQRSIKIDLNTGSWEYNIGSTVWSGPMEVRTGVKDAPTTYATIAGIHLTPLSMYTHQGLPVWSQPASGEAAAMFPSVSTSAHLLFTDESGRRIGYQDGTFIDEIPGASPIIPLMADSGVPETYYLPAGDYTMTVAGTELSEVNVDVFSPDALFQILDATVTSTTIDVVELSQDGDTASFTTNDTNKTYSVVFDRELADTSRVFKVANTQLVGGDKTTFRIVDDKSIVYVNDGGPKTYDLVLEQRGAGMGIFTATGIEIEADETHIIEVEDWDDLFRTDVTLKVDENSDGTVDKEEPLRGETVTHHYCEGWQMLSIPVCCDPNDTDTVIGDDVANPFLWRWNPGDGAYLLADEVNPTWGYWLLIPKGGVVIDATGIEPQSDVTVSVSPAGWHQISAPWPYDIDDIRVHRGTQVKSWNEAVSAGWMADVAWGYNGIEYALASQIAPWSGYWVLTLVDGLTLKFQYSSAYPVSSEGSSLETTSIAPAASPPPPPGGGNVSTGELCAINIPNPIRDLNTTTFKVQGVGQGQIDKVRVEIFDLSGHLVYSEECSAASLVWHTQDNLGEPLANGAYLYRVLALIDGEWWQSELKKLAICR